MKMRNIQTKSVGLFPLPMVILPKEFIRLHIFENKYKALINDCFATGKDFIVPFVFNGKVTAFGTCVKLVDVERFYADGKMDIKIEGSHVVRISDITQSKELVFEVGSAEAIDSSLPNIHKEELNTLYAKFLILNNTPNLKEDESISVYEIARTINLSKDVKIKLLRNASNSIVQSKIILNELRIQVLTAELQSAPGFRYYMN
ncbi:MAG: Lon protease-like protein [Salibacteraceae bacterium]|jgi:Lon protease-like protein